MRFYWFDGKSPQGPLDIAELLAQPGFSAETVVCPVGAERPEDWKPAVNYEPLRDALFKPKPVLISAPPALQAPCPSCRHPNTDDALFCSHCGHTLKEAPDSSAQPPIPQPEKPPFPPPSPALPQNPTPLPGPALPPVAEILPGPAIPKPPEVSAGPRRGPAPGSMGRLAQQQPPLKAPPAAKPPEARSPAAAPSRPVSAPAPASGKKTLLLAAGAFCAALIVMAGIFFWRRAADADSPSVPADLAPPAAAKMGTQEGSPSEIAVKPAPVPPPAPKAAPAAPAKPQAPARKPRARKKTDSPPAQDVPAAAPALPARETPVQLQPHADPSDAELGKLLKERPQELLLPGIPKKVRKVSEEPPTQPPQSPSEGTAGGTEGVLMERAKEQFNFCHQLMRQGNFGDFFDTCLCAKSRDAAPYKGRRRVFIEKASEDPTGELGSTAEIGSVRLDGETALITAKWAGPDGAVERTEKWAVEEGLWCRQDRP